MDLATAYVQILPTTKGMKNELSSVLGSDAESAGRTAGNKFSGALTGTLKAGIAGVAALGTAVIGAGTALTSSVSSVAQYGDNIDKMSQKMGLSATAYQEWDAVMQHSGTSMETMKASMKTLANAAETNSDAFKKLGISEKDLATMSQQELFEATINSLQNVTDTTERTYLAGKVLGRGATELGALLNISAEDTQKMRDAVHELGGVMSDEAVKNSAAFQDNLQDMQTALSGLKNNMLSEFLPAFNEVMVGLTDMFKGDFDSAYEKMLSGIENVTAKIQENLPKIVEGFSGIINLIAEVAPQIIETLGQGIIQTIPNIIPSLVELVIEMGEILIENLPQLVKAGLEVILTLAQGIGEALPDLIPTIVDVVLEIVDTLIDNVDQLIDAAIAIIMGLTDGLIEALPRLIERLPEIIIKIVKALIENAPKLLEASIEIITALTKGLIESIPKLLEATPKIIKAIWDEITKTDWIGLGKNVIDGIVRGLKSAASSVWNAIKDICKDALQSAKEFFGIASPSKLMRDEVGKWIPEGMAVGIEKNIGSVSDAMQTLSDEATADINGNIAGVIDVQNSNSSNMRKTSISGSNSGANGSVQAIVDALSKVSVMMDGRSVGTLVATPVNNELGRMSLRRV